MQLLAQSTSSQDTSAGVAAAIAAMGGVFLIVGLCFAALTVVVYAFIIRRAGYNPWLSLLMLVPAANFIVLLFLAFSEWPVERENKALRAQLAAGGGYPGGPYPSGPYPGTTIAPT